MKTLLIFSLLNNLLNKLEAFILVFRDLKEKYELILFNMALSFFCKKKSDITLNS